jgi:CDP-ribitol ribitolphosphotransferase
MENLIDTKQMTATVTGIHWERIFLHLDVRIDSVDLGNNASDLEFYFVRKGKKRYVASARAKVMEQKDNCYHLKLNITNQGEKKCLPSGTYSLIVCQNENIMAKAVVDRELVSSMSNCSRNFLYRGKKCVYTVSFFVTEGEEDLPFTMRAMPSAETRTGFRKYKRSRKFSFKKAKAFLHPIKKLKKWYHKNHRKIKVKIYRHYLRKYKNMNNVVLFMSEQSETIGSNEKAVMDRMIARGLDKEWTILESYRSSVSKPKLGFKSWVATLKKMAMSTVIVLDDHAPVLDWLKLDEKTKVIQLWHAGAGFKSSGYSRWGHDGCPAPQSCHRQYQYGIAGSKSIAPFFSEVWGINDSRVLPTGMPRIDEYLDKDYREAKTKELYETYPMAKGKKVILFAPTYRGRNKATAHYPYELIDFDRLYELCGEEYVAVFLMWDVIRTLMICSILQTF